MTELGDGVRQLLDGPNMAHLATILPAGAPYQDHTDRVVYLVEPGHVQSTA